MDKDRGMAAFSPKALRLLDAAVEAHAARSERDRWLSWKAAHRADEPRRLEEPAALPGDVVDIVLGALEAWGGGLRDELVRCRDSDEDRIADLDNQLSYLQSVAAFIANAREKPRRDRGLKRA
jgi:hypothetical protein